jgi:hypothetical protein
MGRKTARSYGESVWRELVRSVEPDAVFLPPAPGELIRQAEVQLGLAFPDDLQRLLAETNGVEGQHGLGVVWPLERIVADNIRFRTTHRENYMTFESLFFFADAGNGDQFAFPVTTAGTARNEVFAWDHENDSRLWVADSLRSYLTGWLAGELTL